MDSIKRSVLVARRRLLTFGVLLFLGLLSLPLAEPAEAAAIQVSTRADELITDGDCSLREAVVSVNTSVARDACTTPNPKGPDTIKLKSGTYKFVLDGDGESAEHGSLDVTSPATIVGRGKDETTVDAAGLDRVFNLGATATLRGMTITGGNATEVGGGLVVSNAILNETIVLDDVHIFENEVTADFPSEAGGGGIFVGTPTLITDSEISFNRGTIGGGLYVFDTSVDVRRTLIHDNSVVGTAHGVAAFIPNGASATLENTTVTANPAYATAEDAIELAGSLTLKHSTLAANGGSSIVVDTSGATLTSSNSIVADALSSGNCSFGEDVTVIELNENLTDDNTCFEDALQGDPDLKPLDDYGGPIPTLALKPSSPAINASIKGCVATDARGVPRPQAGCSSNDPNLQDLGAYELARCSTGIVDIVGTPTGDNLSGTTGADVIMALGGNDDVFALGGNDKVCGGGGTDTLNGQEGDDKLLGEDGADHLSGGPGTNDVCIGGPAVDTATGCETKKSL